MVYQLVDADHGHGKLRPWSVDHDQIDHDHLTLVKIFDRGWS